MQPIDHAVLVLKSVSRDPEGVMLHELFEATGIPKASLHRLLQAMVQDGLVVQEERHGRYRLGPRLFGLATAYLNDQPVRRVGQDLLHSLSRTVGQSAHLTVLDGREVVCVDSVDFSGGISFYVRIGRPMPLHASASARAILAFMPHEEVWSLLLSTPMTPFTSATVITRDQLELELQRTRERGWAVTFGEVDPGVLSLAAPIFGSNSQPVGAVTVVGLQALMPPDIEALLAPHVCRTAREISERLLEVIATSAAKGR